MTGMHNHCTIINLASKNLTLTDWGQKVPNTDITKYIFKSTFIM